MLVKILSKKNEEGCVQVTQKKHDGSLSQIRRELMQDKNIVSVVDSERFTYIDTILFLQKKGYPVFLSGKKLFEVYLKNYTDFDYAVLTKNDLHVFGMRYVFDIPLENITKEEMKRINEIRELIKYNLGGV